MKKHFLPASMPGLHFRGPNVSDARLPVRISVPNTSAEGGDVNRIRIRGIRNDPMSPLEIEPGNARPVFPAIEGPPGGGLESRGIEPVRIAGIDGHVIDVPVAVENLAPALATVLG